MAVRFEGYPEGIETSCFGPGGLPAPWRDRLASPYTRLQVAIAPRKLFRFDGFASIFATEVVPVQVSLHGGDAGRYIHYNAATIATFGLR